MFSNFYPFIIVLLQTILQNQREEIEEKSMKNSVKSASMYDEDWMVKKDENDILLRKKFARLLEIVCKVIMPMIGIAFVLGYFVFGLFI